MPWGSIQYAALDRLVEAGLIEGLELDGRRRPYRITTAGAAELRSTLARLRSLADAGESRLRLLGSLA